MVRKPKAALVEIVNPTKKTCNRHFGPVGVITVGNFPAPPYQVDLMRYLGVACGLANPVHTGIVVAGALIDPRQIRLLTTADRVETCPDSDTLLLADATTNSIRVPIDAAIRAMNESVYPKMFNGTDWDRIRGTITRGLRVQIDRENLLIINADLATNVNPQVVLAAVAGQYHKIYGWDYYCDSVGTFEFQCTKGGATRKFARRKTAGVHAMTLVHPIVCDVNTALNFLSNGSNTYYSLRYITEA